uniref:Capsid protein n=1 Tax=Foveavirus mali TaxID=35350 RepID=A0A240G0T8_9VIRU|nr:coat protein [Apple stem pitting virus]ASJ27210.1 coat protein [Apple stem pitting virus]ASJ27211.1 coat protein [Apple stem pitting virus]ASJ27212.1 coat protein [Apple stem pitting virus]ASJ27214.1 coat protein [Apple stem pitting virus]
MTSNGSQPPASLPVASVEETAAPASAPSSSLAVSIPASTPAASEPVVSQVQSLAPIVSGFDPNLHGRLTNEQIRQARGETAGQDHVEGSHSNQHFTSGTATHHNYTGVNSNPFETGTAYGDVPQMSLGPYLTFPGRGSASEPNAQRIFPQQHGINPSAHGADLMASQPNTGNNVGTPFTLGNRAPRNVTSNTGGIRRRLDSIGLRNIRYEPQAGVVASNQKIRAVGIALIGMGIPEHQLTEVGVYLARHCADVGASDKSTLLGTFPGSDITLEEVGTMIKQTEGCTLRQYCAFYAKHVWNLMLQTQSPPANWVGKEFKFETRYAAFDFFFGVESTASLEPADGLIRLPTQAERVANATSKEIQMYRIRSMEGTQAVNFGEVTGGKVGPKPVLSIRK